MAKASRTATEFTSILPKTSKLTFHRLKTLIILSILSVPFTVYFTHQTSPITTIQYDPKNFQEFLRPISVQNASAVFNSIQGALRNKDSQIQPIGVSFIPAVIPQGTLLYHGNEIGEVIKSPEWIAMDYEFSLMFSNRWSKKPNGKTQMMNYRVSDQEFKTAKSGFGKLKDHASLFTFQVVKPLDKMILLDGSSAAKTKTGEMDQQMILAKIPTGEYVYERIAADKICEWGKPFGLDGFIRIEVGYEAVICNLNSDKLRLVSNETIPWYEDLYENDKFTEEENNFIVSADAIIGYDHIKAGNVHDKRDGRILLDYRGFTTPLNKTWISPDTYTRRIHNISEEIKEELIGNLEGFFKAGGANPYISTDWQLITSEIVDKFGPMLKVLNDTFEKEFTTDQEFAYNVRNLTLYSSSLARRFFSEGIDKEHRYEDAMKQAIYSYSHPLQDIETESELLIWSSITTITEKIVQIIFDTFIMGKDFMNGKTDVPSTKTNHQLLKQRTIELLNTLQWTIYYTCPKKCGWDEVSYTPSWGPSPMGWGVSAIGTYQDEEGRYRISQEEQCVSYHDVLKVRHH